MRLEARRKSMDPIGAVVSAVLEDTRYGDTLDHRKILAWTDGVLTAAAVGPERVRPDELARAVFDQDRPFNDAGMAQVSVSLLGLMYSGVVEKLRRERTDYVPRFLEYAHEGEEAVLATEWANGFFAGVRLRGEMWKRLIGTEEGKRLLGPIVVFLSDEDGSSVVLEERPQEEVAEIQAEALQWLGYSAFEISRYWKTHGKRAARADADAFRKIGRNEPCPCGSGKKHKKCCLLADADLA